MPLTALLLWSGMLAVPTAAAELVAERITPTNAAAHVSEGLDAVGGIGDWALSNGMLCAVFSGVEHESDFSPRGGALIDLGFCGRNDDQFVVLQSLRDGSVATPLHASQVLAGLSETTAGIRVLGGTDSLSQVTDYSVDLAQPQRLRISERITRRSDRAPGFRLLTPVLFNYYSLETFLLDTRQPGRSFGYEHVDFATQGVSAFARAARQNDTIVAYSRADSAVSIAYGWRMLSARKRKADGELVELPFFAASDSVATVFLVLTDPFFVGGGGAPGMLEMLQIAAMGLEVGETLELEQELWIGRRSDVAAISDQLFPDAPVRHGRVNEAGVLVEVAVREADVFAPFSTVRAGQDGSYALRLPEGTYQLTALGSAGRRTSKNVSLAAASGELPLLELPAPALLDLPRGEPMRLVFQGLGATADPDLQFSGTGYKVSLDGVQLLPEPVPMVFLAGVESDRRSVALPPGDYRVFATRGIEFGLSKVEVSLAAGERKVLALEAPQRAVPTPGFVAADLHVHSGPSMDNAFPVRERVRTFVAEQGEVMVASEHETLFDFAPIIAELGASEHLVAVTGTEMTGQVPTARLPHTVGHANFFPLPPQRTTFRRGVPANEDRRLREAIYEARQLNPEVFAQLNHARENDDFLRDPPSGDVGDRINNGAYLDHLGPSAFPFIPSQPLSEGANRALIEPDPLTGVRDLDVDAMELLNGKHAYAPGRRRALLADWYSLLLQGERIIGTANSDSHGKHQQVALPRNMVAMKDDSIRGFDERAFIQSLKAGRSYGTTGPLLNVDLDGVGLGEMLNAARAVLTGRLHRAPWVPSGTLRAIVNGEVVAERTLGNKMVVEERFELAFPADSFVVVEFEGEASGDYAVVLPGQLPYAFTNPIYVDANGNGRWDAPGLR